MTSPGLRLTLLLVLGLISCRSAPPHATQTPIGEVRAETPAEALHVAERSAALRDKLLALIPDAKPARAHVWVYSDEGFARKYGSGGIAGLVLWSFPGRYLGGAPRIELPTTSMEHSLAHEWVHLLLGPSWKPLSGAIEEGLANELASQLTPPHERARLRFGYLCAALRQAWPGEQFTFRSPGRDKIRVRRKENATEALGPDISTLEVLRQPKIRKRVMAKRPGTLRLYGLGTLLAEKILSRTDGLRRLHEACAASKPGTQLSPEALLDLAGFDSESELEEWLHREHDAAAPGALLSQPSAFASLVAELERLSGRELDAETVLAEMEATYQWGDSKVLRIEDHADLRRKFKDNWPTRERVAEIKAQRADEAAQFSPAN